MKKVVIFLMAIVLIVPTVTQAEENVVPGARNAILVEANTGQVIYEKGMHDRVAVASLTKMMSQLIILEHIENGSLTWDEQVKASANAAGYGGTQIYLQPGEVMSVRDLMKGISMASANDATVVLAERIAGTEENFVKLMMEKAQKLGLQNTNFVNPTGLDEENHYSSAYDLSIIARELMKHEQIFEFTSLYEDYLRVDTPNKFWLVNTNKLVRFYEGADGLKTGFTDNAMYCMAVTAKRSGMRLLAIVLGEEISKVRNQETMALLDYGFNLYTVDILKEKETIVDKVEIERGNVDFLEIVTKDEISVLRKKDEASKKYTEEVEFGEITLPLKKGTVIGKLKIMDSNNLIGEYDLIANQDVKKKSFFSLLLENLKDIVVGSLVF
ncbi:MAG: D-alanyl-D-alanine carboxypeptidase [bacterium]|nr:D-alanyl-D-alanine carboxypeptidase [bacterium]